MKNAHKKEADEYTVVEASKYIGVSHTTIYNAIRDKLLKHRRYKAPRAFNGVVYIKHADLVEYQEWLEASGNLNRGRPKKEAAK